MLLTSLCTQWSKSLLTHRVSSASFRSSCQQWPLHQQPLSFPPGWKIRFQACPSVQPLPPCPVNCRQVVASSVLISCWTLNPSMLTSVPLHQVCPQYLCSPPPPAPLSAPSPRWIRLPLASTPPPPRYQVSGVIIEEQKSKCWQTFTLHCLCVVIGLMPLAGGLPPLPNLPNLNLPLPDLSSVSLPVGSTGKHVYFLIWHHVT